LKEPVFHLDNVIDVEPSGTEWLRMKSWNSPGCMRL
jgi:hypothetical protein